MWVTCHLCNGSEEYNQKECLLCKREYLNIYIWYYYRGLIWVNDYHDPVSPPSSPK